MDKYPGFGVALACPNPHRGQPKERFFDDVVSMDHLRLLKVIKVPILPPATKKLAQLLEIQWRYHLPYNPTASGNIERFNGLLKRELKLLEQHSSFQLALDVTCFHLNQRERLGREPPHSYLNRSPDIVNLPIDNKLCKFPYKITIKDHKNKLSPQDVIAD